MYGSIAGNIAATLYYLYFQFIGLTLVFLLLRREKPLSKLLIGSVAGSLLLTWLPVLFSFFFGFTMLSHMLALAAALPAPVAAIRFYRMKRPLSENIRRLFANLAGHLFFWVVFLPFMAFWIYLLHTHTILPDGDGAIYTGQCTYGDMNMHLGFITSIARQAAFPPDYSILPGVRLSYPFLSDSISSSLYVMGASLRFAYILPMVFAMAQIFTTVYLFAGTLAGSRNHSSHGNKFPAPGVRLFTLLLFFCNGGFGFAYFLDWASERAYRFSDIFTGFYTTPTNLVDKNIRWVNLVADMFLPQRATLFGYAALFPALWLLYRAVFRNHREYFPAAGLFVAALPMIHTHSFLSAGVVSAVWMFLWLFWKVHPSKPAAGSADGNQSTRSKKRQLLRHPGLLILMAFTAVMCLLQFLERRNRLTSKGLMLTGVSLFVFMTVWGIWLLIRHVKKSGWKELLTCWGVYLACIMILALPQLLFWTFGQVAEGGFVRGHFNWGNQGDLYPWFYLKNIGAPLLLVVGGICACGHKRAPVFLPALFLWWLGELIVFTPNTYDNNKILYVAYFLLCLGAADYGAKLYDKMRDLRGGRLFAAAFLFLASFSGILTLGREAVSRYQLYGTAYVSLAEYVEEHTPPDAVFLTNTRHNNEIASLTGRNIVCGADTFLYFHGLDTTERKNDLQLMFEAPADHLDLYEKYEVSYVVLSSYERGSFQINEEQFRNCFTELLTFGDITLYQVH